MKANENWFCGSIDILNLLLTLGDYIKLSI